MRSLIGRPSIVPVTASLIERATEENEADGLLPDTMQLSDDVGGPTKLLHYPAEMPSIDHTCRPWEQHKLYGLALLAGGDVIFSFLGVRTKRIAALFKFSLSGLQMCIIRCWML